MTKLRATTLAVITLAIVLLTFSSVHVLNGREKVLDMSNDTISGFEACPVHNREFSSERVSAWHEPFGPLATKEWWERVAEAKEKYPFAVPFPAQVEDPEIDLVVRPFCPECRDSFNAFVSKRTVVPE